MIQFLGFNGIFFLIYEINSKSLESESKGQFYNNSCFLLGHRINKVIHHKTIF